jgi:hypothetical protein
LQSIVANGRISVAESRRTVAPALAKRLQFTTVRKLYVLRRFSQPISIQQNQQVASGAESGLLERR